MSTAIVDKLRAERADLVNEIEALMSGEGFDPTDTTFTEARSRAEALDTKIKAIVDFDTLRNAANEVDALAIRSKRIEETQTRAELLSPGEAWVRSREYAAYRETPHGNSGTIEIPIESIFAPQFRAPLLTTSGGYTDVLIADRIRPSEAPASQTPLLDVIGRIPVSQNSVEWVYFPAASPLGTVTAEGAQKTEAVPSIEVRTVTLSTVASWIQYSRQFAEDGGALVAYINGSLGRGILDKFESLAAGALTGAGSGIPVTDNTGGTLLEGIRRAIANVQAAGYNPSVVALNPADYAALDIDILGMTLNGPRVNGSFWGVRPVPVGAIASGTAYVGDFPTGMVQLVRTGVNVYTTDSDITGAGATAASAFRSNILTTLVEGRQATIVHRPEALTKVSGTVTVAAASGGAKK